MDAGLIKPFLESTKNVVETMAFTECVPGKPYVKDTKKAWGDVTGIIGLAGENVSGNMVVSFQEQTILKIVSKMLMEEFTKVTDEVVDAVGELTNMITGGSKPALAELGYQIEMASPMMVTGKGTELKQTPTATPIYVVPFETEHGQFVVEATLRRK